jgi:hypothetical protein
MARRKNGEKMKEQIKLLRKARTTLGKLWVTNKPEGAVEFASEIADDCLRKVIVELRLVLKNQKNRSNILRVKPRKGQILEIVGRGMGNSRLLVNHTTK